MQPVAHPLPVAAVEPEQMEQLLIGAWNAA